MLKQVGEETRAVEEKRREAEESIRRMEAARRDVQGSMTDEKASISVKFASARAALDAEEKTALEQAEQKGRKLLSQIEKKIAHDQHEISELQAAATRLQALAQERDSLTFLQGHLEEMCRTGRFTADPPSCPSQEDIASLKGTEGTVAKFLYGRSPTLDTTSAHNQLQISSDLRTMTAVPASQGRPDHPHRFDGCAQALCCESFSSGHHYWEVDVGGARWCRVGVTYGRERRVLVFREMLRQLLSVSWWSEDCTVGEGGPLPPQNRASPALGRGAPGVLPRRHHGGDPRGPAEILAASLPWDVGGVL
ncbi:E3 ubiquitin-protein ligase TRIM7-like [Petromyzon marinus]|uniref:E3 ubiquitin-protein ligase TRIM7-like n=1 Tax=Petromyzon marinus TaxID=7757 RepID=UPI003F710F8F